ncbi:MAG: amidohydrolase, partial [Bacteroidota bacterium]
MLDLLQLRYQLHQFPEVSGKEVETAKRVANFLKDHKPDKLIEGIGGTSLAALYEFSAEGPLVLIRCELDALPIEEVNKFDHRSTRKGISHKCGHDGHMTILAGLAKWLGSRPLKKGSVVLLYQSAEETGKGAQEVLASEAFQEIAPDYVFALHNLPGRPLHEVRLIDGQFCTTVQSVAIKLTGLQSHAAEPEKGRNPALAIAEILQGAAELELNDPRHKQFGLLTPVYMNLGQKEYGISAGYGEAHFTLRSWYPVHMKALSEKLKVKVRKIANRYRLKHEMEWFDYFPAVINDPYCNEVLEKTVLKIGGQLKKVAQGCKFGEDFGWFTQKYPGIMFGLGAGEDTPALHNERYDFPDEIIETGIETFKHV